MEKLSDNKLWRNILERFLSIFRIFTPLKLVTQGLVSWKFRKRFRSGKTLRIKLRILANKPEHFVLLTKRFIILSGKRFKTGSWMQTQQLSEPGNHRNVRGILLACMFRFPNSDHVIFSREFAFCLFINHAHICTRIHVHRTKFERNTNSSQGYHHVV